MRNKELVVFGDVSVDFGGMELRRSGRTVPATLLELRLLKFFIDNPEHVFSREELIRAVWRNKKRKSRRTVDNSIARLRSKIEQHPSRPVYLQTLHGVGYKFVPVGGITFSHSK